MGSWSIFHWLVVLAVIVLVFGTGKLSKAGRDLGDAIRGFKSGFKESMAEEVEEEVDELQFHEKEEMGMAEEKDRQDEKLVNS